MQTRIDPEIKPIYARVHKTRYDGRLQLESILEEPACMQAMVEKFKQLFIKIKEEESSAILYPYSSSSSAVPISDIKRLPNTYIEMKRYIPGFKPPLPNSDLVYGQIYVGTNTGFDDWKLTFLEWTKITVMDYMSNLSKMNEQLLQDTCYPHTKCQISHCIKN